MTRRSEYVTSFEKGLAVIRAFQPGRARMTLTEVAQACGQTRASARRFLLTLVELGFAKSDGKYFELTPRVLCLGFAFLSSQSLSEIAQPILERVTTDLDESCSIGMLDANDVVYVVRSAGRRRIMSVSLNVGTRLPAYVTSMGQVLLAYSSPETRNKAIEAAEFEPLTSRTLKTRFAFADRLSEVRQRGYALVDSELEEGLRSLAVPIFRRSGEVFAALNVSTQSARVSVSDLTGRYLKRLKAASDEVSEALANH
ncbi:MAG: IclR family transcriptional regulator C-terminal domain-containing protein [Alphaproteobacteria bacterium]|nr:IclR family transcriptional regulator C-terminal domain-containing protein [Alphaproteobacteria bacterium]